MHCVYLLRQASGKNSITIENSSSLPRSISKDSNNLTGAENIAKLPIGPTRPRPGPTLHRQATVAVKLVVKSKPSRQTRSPEPNNISIYRETNVWVVDTVSSSKGEPLSLTTST